MVKHVFTMALVSVLLVSCGGGGGGTPGAGAPGTIDNGTLSISVSYPPTIPLLEQVVVSPDSASLGGRSPRCSLVSGNLPPGLALRGDCALEGRALQPGTFLVSMRVSVAGATNNVETVVAIKVNGPTVMYRDRSFVEAAAIGDLVDDMPNIFGWNASADAGATWSFRLVNGPLPPGLALNPSTGRISGTATTSGAYAPEIQSRLTTPFGWYEPVVTTYHFNVNVPYISYGRPAFETAPGTRITGNVAFLSQPFSLGPGGDGPFPPGVGYTNPTFNPPLPSGLSADPATGTISGIPTAENAQENFNIQATIIRNGVSAATQGTMTLHVISPISVVYGQGQQTARAGVPYLLMPTIVQVSAVPLSASATFRYALRAGDALPPGLSVDPATGAISGTPTTTGSFRALIDVSVTDNAVTWREYGQSYIVVE